MKDARLELGRYISNPFDNSGRIASQLNFRELFRNQYDTDTGGSPWVPSRFTSDDILKSIQSRKVKLNPRLNFVPNSPFWDNENQLPDSKYEMFEGLGRFNKADPNFGYDFENGRALTKVRPQDQPDFNEQWVEAYKLSPTVKPDKRARNPMPRMKNPDPNGFIMSIAEKQAENEVEGNVSVAQLLANKKLNPTEEREGERVVDDEKNISPGKTIT
jgi:hypothetical protein